MIPQNAKLLSTVTHKNDVLVIGGKESQNVRKGIPAFPAGNMI